jgi:hypothetical protein
MSARDDLNRATEEARAQVDAARSALAASRAARSGGPARNPREAERQLHALRGAVSDDVRALRERLTGVDASARRGAATAAVVGAGALASLVGSGLAVRGRVRRTIARRGVQQQAAAIARAMLTQSSSPDVTPRREGRGGRGGRGALIAVLAVGAAVAGAALLQQQRNAPVDDDDLWLPERDLGPA